MLIDSELWTLFRLTADGDGARVGELLLDQPALARAAAPDGAQRTLSTPYFLQAIGHYAYAGDTGLHIAAGAYDTDVARRLVALGADVAARNRHGATPLHYAAAGNPNSMHWDPAAQAQMIEYLLSIGADPNAADARRVAPLHVAVRTRCAAAVRTLLSGGADARLENGNGSAPLDLAIRPTGRGGSGSAAAHEQQESIIQLFTDAGGKTAERVKRRRGRRR